MRPVVAIDFETANRHFASVCAIGVSKMEDGVVEEVFETLIQPNENVSYFSPMNVRVHGIHPNDVKHAPMFPVIYEKLSPFFDEAIFVAHNAKFDMTCLREACLNNDLPVPTLSYFDSVRLAKRAFPQLEHHRLNDVCDYLNIPLDHHRAGSDAYGCLMIVAHIMNRLQEYDIEVLLKKAHMKVYELKGD